MMEENRVEQNTQSRDGKFFNFRPITLCALFVAIGVLLAFGIIVLDFSPWVLLLTIPCAGLFAWLSLPLRKALLWTIILAVVAVIGGACFSYSTYSYRQYPIYDGQYAVVGRVVEKHAYGDSYTLLLEDVTVAAKKENGKLRAYLPASLGENIRLSDEIGLFGYLQTQTSIVDGYGVHGNEVSKGVAYRLSSVQSVSVMGNQFDLFLWIRQRVEDVLQAGLGGENAAFCAGLLLGDDEGIDRDLLQNARYGGIAHVFAVSGLHIGVLFGVCALLTSGKFFTSKPKIFSFLFTTAVLILYGGVCGFSSSVLRATITCLAAYACNLLGGKKDSLEGVSLAAVALLLLFPATLFEVGFLLSFGACYGILLLARPLREGITSVGKKAYEFCREKVFKKPKKQKIVDVFQGDTPPKSLGRRAVEKAVSFLSATLAAWLAVTPVSIAFFGYASAWSLLLNCLFVPLLSAFFVALLVVTALACILPFAAPVLYFLPSGVCSLVLFFFEMIAFGSAKAAYSWPSATCYYLSLLTMTDKFAVKRRYLVLAGLGLLIAAILCFFVVNL